MLLKRLKIEFDYLKASFCSAKAMTHLEDELELLESPLIRTYARSSNDIEGEKEDIKFYKKELSSLRKNLRLIQMNHIEIRKAFYEKRNFSIIPNNNYKNTLASKTHFECHRLYLREEY